MKRLVILAVVLAGLSAGANAQNSFPTSNAIWNYKVSASDWFSNQSGEKNIYYTICGDTIVDGYTYSKLHITYDTVLCGKKLGEFLGGLRQEEQKIYFLPYSGNEFLLYDFGVSIGDSVYINYGFRYHFGGIGQGGLKDYHSFKNYAKTLIVLNIEVKNGIKQIYLGEDAWIEDIWYEGFGSVLGLFNAGRIDILDGYSFDFQLQCFKYNDTIKYMSNYECQKCFCKNVVEVKEKCFNTEILNIFPNPTNDILNIEIAENVNIQLLLLR